jgi:predicted nuclease with RNAse H fold
LSAALAVGVDVAARRGCDVVALGDDLVARPVGRVYAADELATLLVELQPAVVAIDSPPTWAPDAGARRCERELQQHGISIFTTPNEARGTTNPFYDWMRTGFAMFAGARGYPTLETFPHATAIALLGRRPDRGLLRDPRAKREWRLVALHAAGVDVSALGTIDEIDAALCAVTGRAYLAGDAVALGDPVEGVLTLPRELPLSTPLRT